MDTQLTINPLASSDVGGTAGHDAAACVRARGECDGKRVCYARDANCVLSSTTLSPRARQVVVPQAQNFRASAAAIALVLQPSTVENAGADASEASISQRSVHFTTDPPVDDEEGWTKCFGKTARGRAKRSAKCGTSVPSAVPAAPAVRRPTRSSFRPSASVTSLDAVAPPVTPSVPSAAVPLPPWEGVAYDRNGMPTHPAGIAPFDAVAPSVSIPVPTLAGVAPFDAVAPSVAPTALRVASTNDSPISQPTGAAPQPSTNDSPISQSAEAARQRRDEMHALSKTRLFVPKGSRFVSSGMDPRMANRQAPPAQTTITIVTHDTPPNLKHVEFSPNDTIEEESQVTIQEESPNVTIQSPNVTFEESPSATIEEESPNVTIQSPNITFEESPSATIEERRPTSPSRSQRSRPPRLKTTLPIPPLAHLLRPSILPSNLVLIQIQLLELRPSLLIIPYLAATPLRTPFSRP